MWLNKYNLIILITLGVAFTAVVHSQDNLKHTDVQKLLQHHQSMIDAHLASDETLMEDQWGDEITFIYNGSINIVTKADAIKQMHDSLRARKHRVYKDLEPPIVTLSDDRTLGWIMVRVRAEGDRLDKDGNVREPLAFTSAWVSLYRKVDGSWKMVGNVSNFEAE